MLRSRLIPVLVLHLMLFLAPSARGVGSADLVISQVFAGGGNAGAPYTNDYVELFNRGSSSVDLASWSVQYATATGTTWSPTPLSGTLAPGRRYLVQFASGGTVGLALPAPDAMDTTNLAASGGKVALARTTAALTCGATAGSCSPVPVVRDLVGYGTASDFESAAAPALSNSTALTRAGAGCADTDANGVDFTADPPTPHNSATAAATCGSGVGAATFAQSAAVVVDVQSTISLSLERATVSFGSVSPGDRPAAVSERVTVTSTDTAGYALTVRRTPFTPVDLPLGLTASAAAGGQLSAPLAGGALVALLSNSDLLLGTTATRSASGGDVWPTSIAFTTPLPAVPPGHYAATLVYTVIGGTIG